MSHVVECLVGQAWCWVLLSESPSTLLSPKTQPRGMARREGGRIAVAWPQAFSGEEDALQEAEFS